MRIIATFVLLSKCLWSIILLRKFRRTLRSFFTRYYRVLGIDTILSILDNKIEVIFFLFRFEMSFHFLFKLCIFWVFMFFLAKIFSFCSWFTVRILLYLCHLKWLWIFYICYLNRHAVTHLRCNYLLLFNKRFFIALYLKR